MVLSFRHAHHPVKTHKSLVCPRFPCQYFWMRFPKSLVQSWGHGDAIKPLKTYINMSNRMTSRNIDETWQNLVVYQTMQGRWKCLVISTYMQKKQSSVSWAAFPQLLEYLWMILQAHFAKTKIVIFSYQVALLKRFDIESSEVLCLSERYARLSFNNLVCFLHDRTVFRTESGRWMYMTLPQVLHIVWHQKSNAQCPAQGISISPSD